ncbi:MAG: hypothetical protein P1U35_02110 [Cycloclasticus sp.]|nr:hypothetical protein [Cycloclasticus sp.]
MKKRERLILQEMRVAGVYRATAEFMTAQELGDIEGDLVFIDEEKEERNKYNRHYF